MTRGINKKLVTPLTITNTTVFTNVTKDSSSNCRNMFVLPTLMTVIITFVTCFLVHSAPRSIKLPSVRRCHGSCPDGAGGAFRARLAAGRVLFGCMLGGG